MQSTPQPASPNAGPNGQIRRLTTISQVAAATNNDPLLMWATQGWRPGVQAWSAGDAVAVACPDLARRDRLAVCGEIRPAARLVRHALAELGPSYRPIGDAHLIRVLPEVVDELEIAGEFGWMDTAEPVPAEVSSTTGASRASPLVGRRPRSRHERPRTRQVPAGRAHWLPDRASTEIDDLLDRAFVDSYARPGRSGVLRWAGARDADDTLVAVAAEAWSAPAYPDGPPGAGVGLIAGVATDERVRGSGYGRQVCSLLVDALVSGYGRAALMVDTWNIPAIALYERLGLRWRPVAAARATAARRRP